jgi:hypothetical protein
MSSILRLAIVLLGAVHSVTAAPVELSSRGTYYPCPAQTHNLTLGSDFDKPPISTAILQPVLGRCLLPCKQQLTQHKDYLRRRQLSPR